MKTLKINRRRWALRQAQGDRSRVLTFIRNYIALCAIRPDQIKLYLSHVHNKKIAEAFETALFGGNCSSQPVTLTFSKGQIEG
jgi:hypothetical protein